MQIKSNNEKSISHLDKKIDLLQSAMLDMPQAECPVTHHFGPGVYIREAKIAAGVVAIGHYHKTDHLCILLQGSMLVLNDDGSKTLLSAPYTFVAKPGRKVVYVVEDIVFHNVHATDETDIDKLEDTYLKKDDNYQISEQIKMSALTADAESHRIDYEMAMEEMGIPLDVARNLTENESDQSPMPGPVHPYRVTDSPIEGKGYFLTIPAKSGAILAPARINNMRTPAGRYVNHSLKPNAKMSPSEDGNIYLVATENINGCLGGGPGEEVTIDYRQAIKLVSYLAYKKGELCQQ